MAYKFTVYFQNADKTEDGYIKGIKDGNLEICKSKKDAIPFNTEMECRTFLVMVRKYGKVGYKYVPFRYVA